MKRLLSTTTALSLAMAPVQPWPLLAQTLLDDGSVVAADGTLLCQPTADAPCDLEAILTDLAAAAEAQGQADEAAATAAAAEAQRLADEADEAAAAAAAEVQRQADEAATAAAAEAQRQAEEAAAAEAQRQADEAAAAAAAEVQRQADEAAAEAQRQADEAATAAAAAAEAQRQADETAAAEAQRQADEAAAAAAAGAQRQADEAAAAEAQRQADEAAAAEAQKLADEANAAVPAEPAAPAETAVLPALSAESEAAFEAAATAEAEAAAVAEVVPTDAPEAAPVDLPLVSDEALQVVTDLLTLPEDGAGDAPAPVAATAMAAETEAGAAPQGETVTTVTEADARSSFEEFSAAPTLVEGGKKKSGLSDLEKVGLLALGALVVGSVLKDGREVVSNSGDRVVVREPGGNFAVYKDDDTLLRRPGATVRTQTFSDGSTRSTVTREDGTEVVTIRDAAGRVLRRAAYDRQGFETVLIDDLAPEERIDVATLPPPRQSNLNLSTATSAEDRALRAELARIEAGRIGRSFSLRQIRDVKEVRRLAASIDVDNITFDTGSAVIRTTEARNLAALGQVMQEILDADPAEVFLIEGHTDAVGSAASNLMLSDRRAESVALALTEYFAIPPENMVVQGYGEFDLRIVTEADERANRRVAVRVISPLMRSATR